MYLSCRRTANWPTQGTKRPTVGYEKIRPWVRNDQTFGYETIDLGTKTTWVRNSQGTKMTCIRSDSCECTFLGTHIRQHFGVCSHFPNKRTSTFLRRLIWICTFFQGHYVNISVPMKLCCISVILIYILSILFMMFISKLLILYKIKLNRHKNRILFNN